MSDSASPCDAAGPFADFLRTIWLAAGGGADALSGLTVSGTGALPSAFAVTDLAAASVGAAGLAAAELVGQVSGRRPPVQVDRRLAAFWFGLSLRPQGWALPPMWDPIAGDYRAEDGWIRLHTNAPHHCAAALAVLGVAKDRQAVAGAVAAWRADALEAALVEAGGCAAAMRGIADWADHPQGRAVAGEPLLHRDEAGEGPRPRWSVPADRPLRDVRVLDLTRVLAGPVATRFLAGLGARVLRIDPPGWDEPGVVPEVVAGKNCARLDLRDRDDRALFERLLAGADVLVHGYRPDALERLGLGHERRRALNPALVDVSLDAYGWSGPWAGRRGFDSLVQMSTGIAEAGMRAAGGDRPVPLPVQALDHAAGYIMAAAAVRGLTRRLACGTGSRMRTSLAAVARLLVLHGNRPAGMAPLAPERPDDLAPVIEHTAWGPAKRLKSLVAIGDASLGWDLPAGPLGASPAAW